MSHDSEFVFLYSTVPDSEAAENIGRALVEARLAACVNIFPPMLSIYRWEDKLETSRETAMLIKTRRALAERVLEMARGLHPYSVPCFLLLPIEDGNADYLTWAREQTLSDD
ncbi:MAG TPA: divalent-cation tolerance protein CutA [Rhizomicrobium sp.]